MLHIEKFTTCNRNLFETAKEIRTKVFVEEQKTPLEEEFDQFDDASVQYVLFAEGKAVATARYRAINGAYKLERFAVLIEERGRGYGKKMVQHLLGDVLPQKKPIFIYAQLPAQEFYRRLGFVPEGDVFYEVGIPHVVMFFERAK